VGTRQFAAALRAADDAERWPSDAGPGRIDLVRGEAYEWLGEDQEAERCFLQAYRSDTDNFWAVADLAEHYASRGDVVTRRQRTSTYVMELRTRFAGHPALGQVLARVDRMLKLE
jgi:tetratricopeptide (TPR) repeat protein